MSDLSYEHWYSRTYQAFNRGHLSEAKAAAEELQIALNQWFLSSDPWHGSVGWTDMAFLVKKVQEASVVEEHSDGDTC